MNEGRIRKIIHVDMDAFYASVGRTVTVKIKWADFQISTRSRSMETTIQTRENLHQLVLGLIRSVFPPPKGIRLVGVTLSNFQAQSSTEASELPLS
jgi:DNA polymerase IV